MEPKCHAAKHEGPMECTVNKCTNKENEGGGYYLHVVEAEFGILGVEWVCIPCWLALLGKEDARFSQVYRNMKEQMFRSRPDVEEYYK